MVLELAELLEEAERKTTESVLVEDDEVELVGEGWELSERRLFWGRRLRLLRRERRRLPRPSGRSATTLPSGRTVPAGSMSCHLDAKSARVVMFCSQGSVSG